MHTLTMLWIMLLFKSSWVVIALEEIVWSKRQWAWSEADTGVNGLEMYSRSCLKVMSPATTSAMIPNLWAEQELTSRAKKISKVKIISVCMTGDFFSRSSF